MTGEIHEISAAIGEMRAMLQAVRQEQLDRRPAFEALAEYIAAADAILPRFEAVEAIVKTHEQWRYMGLGIVMAIGAAGSVAASAVMAVFNRMIDGGK